MKKVLSLILALCLLALPLLSFAEETAPERTVVTALASEVNPDALASVSVNARITGYDAKKNTLTLEIIVPRGTVITDEVVDTLLAANIKRVAVTSSADVIEPLGDRLIGRFTANSDEGDVVNPKTGELMPGLLIGLGIGLFLYYYRKDR